MEIMKIKVESLIDCDGWIIAQARATAICADIQLQVRFLSPPEATQSELRDMARNEVLRHLDPA